MESFRQFVVDRAVISALVRGWKPTAEPDDPARLDRETRGELARQVLLRLNKRAMFRGKALKIGDLMRLQASQVANVLMRRGRYKPFLVSF